MDNMLINTEYGKYHIQTEGVKTKNIRFDSKKRYKFKCENGHIFYMRPFDIMNNDEFCSKCLISKSESYAKYIKATDVRWANHISPRYVKFGTTTILCCLKCHKNYKSQYIRDYCSDCLKKTIVKLKIYLEKKLGLEIVFINKKSILIEDLNLMIIVDYINDEDNFDIDVREMQKINEENIVVIRITKRCIKNFQTWRELLDEHILNITMCGKTQFVKNEFIDKMYIQDITGIYAKFEIQETAKIYNWRENIKDDVIEVVNKKLFVLRKRKRRATSHNFFKWLFAL